MADLEHKPRWAFINLPVADLEASKRFFTTMGFQNIPNFTDDKAAAFAISEQTWVMLLSRPFFQGFTDRQLCDTSTYTEALVALSCDSREEVDQMLALAIEAGGSDAGHKQDHGFMYGTAFYDLDGHHWELVWMDPAAIPAD